ncbi:MAG: DegV family protein [Lachnospiraceae bacterium]|nr:DegV family protein [Lachnospiraceae bacterium]
MYIVTCCSTVDLSEEHLKERNIRCLPFHYELDGTSYLDDFGKTVPLADFYEAMRNGAETRTSQINITEYYDFFKGIFEEGYDILHIAFSSGLSGSINSANNAAAMLADEYPDRKIRIVDSVNASAGHGLVVDYAADLLAEGLSLDDAADLVEARKLHAQGWFFTTTLKYLVRGGRVSKTAGLIGDTLGICPLLNINMEGHLIPREKIRTKKKVMAALVSRMLQVAEGGADYAGPCHICHSDCIDDADAVIALIEENFPNLRGKIELHEVGTIIGSHTGPGTIGAFFWGTENTL